MDRMGKMRDLREKQAATPEPQSQGDWRKRALYNIHQNSEAAQKRTSSLSDRDLEQGAMAFTDRRLKLEAAQERTSSLSDRDLEQGAMAFTDRRLKGRERRWLDNRSGSGVAAASTEHQIHRHRRQESKAKFRRNDAHSNPSKLGRRKGLWNSAQIDSFAQWHKGELSAPMLDLQQCYQDQYIQNNYHKDETEEQ